MAFQAGVHILLVLLLILVRPPCAGAGEVWRELEPGFSLASFTVESAHFYPAEIVALRLDPEAVEFVLLNSSRTGKAASLTAWADQEDLVAAINASMYLPDNRTSTGYMRSGDHENNSRIVANFGAFFVAGPRDPSLPGAALLDRAKDPWEARLPQYDIVVQNYRLIDADGRMLWTPGGPSSAAAAVGQDKQGRILFIHSREPMTGADFGALLLTLPLDLRMAMYVEGGSQAGLLVRAGEVNEVWMGRRVADLWTSGNKNAPLPNVLGVKRRQRKP